MTYCVCWWAVLLGLVVGAIVGVVALAIVADGWRDPEE